MSIQRQTEILNALTQSMHDSATTDYVELIAKYKYKSYEEGFSVRANLSLIFNDHLESILYKEYNTDISLLIEELHNLMQTHTGGNWTSFTLTLTAEGRATTKFNYDPIEEE